MWKWLAVLGLTGCEALVELYSDPEINGDLATQTTSVTSNAGGIATFEIDVASNTEGFLLTAESNQWLALEKVTDPSGEVALHWEDWYGVNRSLTGAFYADGKDLLFNWPIRAEDGPLTPGVWRVEVAAINANNYYAPDTTVDATLQHKRDSNLDEGNVYVRIVYAEGVGDNDEVVQGTEDAVDHWIEIYAERGLSLEVAYDDGTVDADLPFPDSGEEDLVAESANGDNKDITLVIGETIDNSTEYYGVAGSIPGALIAAPRSLVVISWLANAGGDGSFSDEDVRIYGETLAHEVGHYLGLFHTVESDYAAWDAIDDTEECSSAGSCDQDQGDNLMYPYPVCDWSSCTPQTTLSDGQSGVIHRYTGTL
jgi:hypothetical protein